MFTKKSILLAESSYKLALVLSKIYAFWLVISLFLFVLFEKVTVLVFCAPLLLVLAAVFKNKYNLLEFLSYFVVPIAYLLLVILPIKPFADYDFVLLGLLLVIYSLIYLLDKSNNYIASDFKFWLKYNAWFLLLLGITSVEYSFYKRGVFDLNVNSFFLIIGLIGLSIIYTVMILWSLQRSNSEQKNREDCKKLSEEYKEKIDSLNTYFQTSKDFLDLDYSLDNLSDALQMDKKDISFLLNHILNKSFYSLLAEERVKVAKKLLEKYADIYTIDYVMAQAGFRSKSSFNRYFKEYTKQTPSEFRDQKLNI
ncbi:AraC-like DNA-binding protein [Myroides indicus]|uniref:AraC-like DNA-binding protein n=1 Tax=Myroides indicus TaxID=1323422 RepID=A0A4V3E8Y0_9FLAO|nr:AraC-like DNA-binding protein [Myroides indicus]